MKKNLKIILSGVLLSSFLLGNIANASIYYPEKPIDNIKKDEILNKYISIIKNNRIKQDYEYNREHFYSKKILLNISIPKEVKKEFSEFYFILGNSQPIYFLERVKGVSENNDIKKDEGNSDYKNVIKYDLKNIDNPPKEFIINLNDIKKLIDSTDKYGKSLSFTLYGKKKDGKEYQLSNSAYLYFYINTLESKKSFIKNKIYKKYRTLYVNLNDKIKKVLSKIKNKNPDNYLEILNKIDSKIDELIKKNEEKENSLINNIFSEEDFNKYLEDIYRIEKRLNIYKSISYIIKREIKTYETEDVIDDIFKDYQ